MSIISKEFWSFDEDTGELEIKEGVATIAKPYGQSLLIFRNKEDFHIDSCGIGLDNIKSIKFPTSINMIEPHAFYGCKNLRKIVFSTDFSSIDKEPLYIRSYAFDSCVSLTKIKFDINRSVVIFDGTFYRCLNLTEVELPKKIESLSYRSFAKCINLERIYIHKSTIKRWPSVDTTATWCNDAQVIIVDDDFEMAYEDKKKFEKSSEASNEVAEIQTVSKIQTHKSYEMAKTQTVSKIQMPTSFCGVIKPNLLSNRKPGDATNFVGIPKKSKR